MFAQSADLMIIHSDRKIRHNGDYINEWQAMTFEGVHFDVHWGKDACAPKIDMPPSAMRYRQSLAMTVIAVDAPYLKANKYTYEEILMLARTIKMVYMVAIKLDCTMILSGLMGGGAYRGNRPLVLLLHLLLQPEGTQVPLVFHNAIMGSYGAATARMAEARVVQLAEEWRQKLAEDNACTVEDVVRFVYEDKISTSHDDADINDGRYLTQLDLQAEKDKKAAMAQLSKSEQFKMEAKKQLFGFGGRDIRVGTGVQ